MARQGRLAVFALLVVIASAGCAGEPSASASPAVSAAASATPAATASSTASASPSRAPTPIAFTSDRYGYSVRLPAGWYVREEELGDWQASELNYVGPGTDSFEEDYPGRGTTADFPGITFGLYVSAAKPERGTTLDRWIDELATTMHDSSLCQGTPERESTTIGSESARLVVYDRTDCRHDQQVVVAGVLHGGMGYALTWLARAGQPDARRGDLNSVLATFRFTR